MKKIFGLFLLFAVMLLLAACKDDKKTTTKVSTTTAAGVTTTAGDNRTVIKFAVQADSTPALNKIVEEFNKKNHGYKVETVIMTNNSGDMHDQLVTSLSSGSSGYDVISMDVVWAGEFAAAGYLEPLDQFMQANGWNITKFNAGSMAAAKYAGKHYALPYFPDLGFLYYRKDIVNSTDAAKLESGDYTWNDLLTMAENETYLAATGIEYGFVFQANQYEGLVCNLNEFTNNWQNIEDGLEMMKKFTDSNSAPDTILTFDEGATHNAFLQGKAVFARNWPYMNGMVGGDDSDITADQVGYAPLPEGGTVGGWLLGINKASTKLAGAKEFVKFLAGPEGQKLNAIHGSYLPGFNDLLEDEDVLEANALLTSDAFKLALQNTISRPVVAEYSGLSDIISTNAHAYLSGGKELSKAAAAIEGALDALIDKSED